MKKRSIYVGTSGWSYKEWKEFFYPEKMKSTEWLTHYADTFHVTEINASFYHLPLRKTVEGWVQKVPDNFLFCPKMSRYLTHIKRLKDPEEPLERFFHIFEPMKEKMGPVLIQLPPSLTFDYDTAEYLYRHLHHQYKAYDFAMEVRHPTWMQEESITLMAKYNIAFVISQSGHGFPYAEHITSRNIYIRFHGPDELYKSGYSDEMLRNFSVLFKEWIKQGHVIWSFFNNTYYEHAINNSLRLLEMMKE